MEVTSGLRPTNRELLPLVHQPSSIIHQPSAIPSTAKSVHADRGIVDGDGHSDAQFDFFPLRTAHRCRSGPPVVAPRSSSPPSFIAWAIACRSHLLHQQPHASIRTDNPMRHVHPITVHLTIAHLHPDYRHSAKAERVCQTHRHSPCCRSATLFTILHCPPFFSWRMGSRYQAWEDKSLLGLNVKANETGGSSQLALQIATMAALAPILARLGLSQYLDRFVTEGFDTWETLLEITESDLYGLPANSTRSDVADRAQ